MDGRPARLEKRSRTSFDAAVRRAKFPPLPGASSRRRDGDDRRERRLRRRSALLEACLAGRRSRAALRLLTAAAELGGLVLEAARTRGTPRPAPDGAAPLIGSTPVMASLRERVERVAATGFTVLIEGESGTGKELVARQIHELSRRRAGPFVAVNCAAVVETASRRSSWDEETDGDRLRGRRGQVRARPTAARCFSTKCPPVAVGARPSCSARYRPGVERVGVTGPVAWTPASSSRESTTLSDWSEGLFRADLFYRLSGVDIMCRRSVAARRHPGLAVYCRASPCHGELTIADAALDALRLYDWPGNVRELERLMERAVTLVASHQIDSWTISAARLRPLRRGTGALDRGQRVAARVGQPLRAAHFRALRQEQASGRALSGHQLPHAGGVPGIRLHGGSRRGQPDARMGAAPRRESCGAGHCPQGGHGQGGRAPAA